MKIFLIFIMLIGQVTLVLAQNTNSDEFLDHLNHEDEMEELIDRSYLRDPILVRVTTRDGDSKVASIRLKELSRFNGHKYCELEITSEGKNETEYDKVNLSEVDLNMLRNRYGFLWLKSSWGLSFANDHKIAKINFIRTKSRKAEKTRNQIFKLAQYCNAQRIIYENAQYVAASCAHTKTHRPPIMEHSLLSLINKLRVKEGKESVIYDASLSKIAKKHTRYSSNLPVMRANHFFWWVRKRHIRKQFRARGEKISMLAENSSYYMGNSNAIVRVDGNLEKSSGHKRNTVNKNFDTVGIGITTKKNRIYADEIFTKRGKTLKEREDHFVERKPKSIVEPEKEKQEGSKEIPEEENDKTIELSRPVMDDEIDSFDPNVYREYDNDKVMAEVEKDKSDKILMRVDDDPKEIAKKLHEGNRGRKHVLDSDESRAAFLETNSDKTVPAKERKSSSLKTKEKWQKTKMKLRSFFKFKRYKRKMKNEI